MKRLLLCLFVIAFTACKQYDEDFFTSISFNDIKEISIPKEYKMIKEDYMLPDSPIIEEAMTDFSIRYNTAKKYKVIIYGDVMFHNDGYGFWDSSRNDSIKLKRLVITGEGIKNTVYDIKNPIDFKTCIIPSRILYSIRDDFFLKTKFTKFNFGRITFNPTFTF